ncbi:MAG: hypothetical protein HRT58_10015 [Crocinitomicaceae bacterium]|nr:hypothetical protein [Flavobacteriales bacterium]NQZ35989.1 hypothetical protein [Crocinitomicaceae bacterium]
MKTIINLLLVTAPLLLLACSGSTADKPSNADKPSKLPNFEKQLIQELKAITETYSEPNHGFIYTVFENGSAQIQVVHCSFIHELKTTNTEFGLAIAIAFDETFPGEIENHKRFKNSEYFSKFTAYEWNDIPSYGINMKTDYQGTAAMLNDILLNIYGFDESTNFSTDSYDQGAL